MLYKLESLRGLFAILVVIAHCSFTFNDHEYYFWKNLDLLIEYFFVLSGFIMSLAYEKKIRSGLPFKKYFLLRLGRIYPLHMVTLFLIVLLLSLKIFSGTINGYGEYNTIKTFISNLFLTHSLGLHNGLSWNFVSWSISAEFYTYLVFYLFLITIDRNKRFLFPSLIVIICYTILYTVNSNNIAFTFNYGFLRTLGGFYIGVILYRTKTRFKPIKHKSIINIIEVGSILLFTITALSSYRIPFHDLYMMISFVLMVFIFSELENGFLGKILHLNILKTIGKYSYSIYMTHIIIIYLYELILGDCLKIELSNIHGYKSVILNALICITTCVVSKYSYVYIEDYFRVKTKKYVNGL